MKTNLIVIAASLALLAACDRVEKPANTPTIEAPRTGIPNTATPSPSVMNQDKPIAPATTAERKKSDEPVQGQVDTTQPAQRKGFEVTK